MSHLDAPSTPVLPRNSMTLAEFRIAKPGILPDTILYNDNVTLFEKLYEIDGQWVFLFRDGRLGRVCFMDIEPVHSAASFQTRLSSVKIVIEDFTRSFGPPTTHVQGDARYIDPNHPNIPNPAQRRHMYHDVTWSIQGAEIRIIFQLKSNRADDPLDMTYADYASEYWSYDFQIDMDSATSVPENAPLIYGRYYLGMPLDAFAARFPALFPQGTAPSGQWTKREDWQGIEGEWGYIFMHGKLVQTQYLAQFQNKQVNERSFETCKKGTLAIVEDLKRHYGKPNQEDVNTLGFKMPNPKKNTYHHDVTVQWNAVQGMRIVVEFSRFYGRSGCEGLIVNVQMTDKVFAGYE